MNLLENSHSSNREALQETDIAGNTECLEDAEKIEDIENTEDTDHTDDTQDLRVTEPVMRQKAGKASVRKKHSTTTIVLSAVILALLFCLVLLMWRPWQKKQDSAVQMDQLEQLEKDIAEYAQAQKQEDQQLAQEEITIAEQEIEEEQTPESEEGMESDPAESADADKTAVVVDIEDENDISYTKEYILKEALPYFEENNQEAIWDLAHLKRYVKLSGELKGTDSYYYTGETNAAGEPDGLGLAIYEDNSYYYGGFQDGKRSGEGRWFRFYIRQKTKENAMGKYMSHSYAGAWADDLPNGEGSEHYDVDLTKLEARERIIQNVVGNFQNGLYDGELFANTTDSTGTIDEWYGNAHNGVFDLWRDVSAIGECSVWQNKTDKTLCLDIDESENKNQGIRELLK